MRPGVRLDWAASDARLTMLRPVGAGPEPETRDWGHAGRQAETGQGTGEGGFTGFRNASQATSANGKPKMPNNIKQSHENLSKSFIKQDEVFFTFPVLYGSGRKLHG